MNVININYEILLLCIQTIIWFFISLFCMYLVHFYFYKISYNLSKKELLIILVFLVLLIGFLLTFILYVFYTDDYILNFVRIIFSFINLFKILINLYFLCLVCCILKICEYLLNRYRIEIKTLFFFVVRIDFFFFIKLSFIYNFLLLNFVIKIQVGLFIIIMILISFFFLGTSKKTLIYLSKKLFFYSIVFIFLCLSLYFIYLTNDYLLPYQDKTVYNMDLLKHNLPRNTYLYLQELSNGVNIVFLYRPEMGLAKEWDICFISMEQSLNNVNPLLIENRSFTEDLTVDCTARACVCKLDEGAIKENTVPFAHNLTPSIYSTDLINSNDVPAEMFERFGITNFEDFKELHNFNADYRNLNYAQHVIPTEYDRYLLNLFLYDSNFCPTKYTTKLRESEAYLLYKENPGYTLFPKRLTAADLLFPDRTKHLFSVRHLLKKKKPGL